MKRGLVRFWYWFKNRYFRREEGPGKPLRFICGSEEELRRVTTWVCHINSEVFTGCNEVVFGYTSRCKGWERIKAHRTVQFAPIAARAYLETWVAVIIKHNLFTGTHWTQYTILAENTVKFRFDEEPVLFVVRVHPPSAHERAEALLSLLEWLDGKVNEQKKRELLQLPDDVEV